MVISLYLYTLYCILHAYYHYLIIILFRSHWHGIGGGDVRKTYSTADYVIADYVIIMSGLSFYIIPRYLDITIITLSISIIIIPYNIPPP